MRRWLVALSIAAVAAGAQAEVDVHSFALQDPAKAGKGGQTYLTICAACHDAGLEHAPQRATLSMMSPQSIYRALTLGVMAAQGRSLADADRIAVAEFLSGRKIDAGAQSLEPPACQGAAAAFDTGDPPPFPGWGLTPGNTHLIPTALAGIDKTSLGRLRLKWALGFPDSIRARSQPGLAGGAVYVGSHNGALYALDRRTGCARWVFQAGAEIRTGIVISPWKAGDDTAKPLVYFGDLVGNVFAVSARDGSLVWRAHADPHPNVTLTGTPTLFEGTLYVPVSAVESIRPADPQYPCCTFRGSVAAYDALTGKLRWQRYTISEAPRLLGKNNTGTDWYGPSGAPIWNSPAIDAGRHLLYVGTGDNGSSPATNTSDAVMAMDLRSGTIKWAYQALAGDAYNIACISSDKTNCPKENGRDFDIGAGVILAKSRTGREIVLAAQKSGAVFAIDPDTGKRLWKAEPGRGGVLGGILFGMAAGDGKVYVPINDAADGRTYTLPARPGVQALDMDTGRPLWSVEDPQSCGDQSSCSSGYAQAITATPELVFAGGEDGRLRIFDAATGATLWRFDSTRAVTTVSGIKASGGSFGGGAAPIAYRGMLFAASGYGLAGQMPGNLLLAFELGE